MIEQEKFLELNNKIFWDVNLMEKLIYIIRNKKILKSWI